MKQIFFAMAALAALSFAGCQKDGNPNGQNPVKPGKPTGMSLALRLPTENTTKTLTNPDGTPIVGTTVENNITNVAVFIFESNGEQAASGGYTPLTASDFTPDGNGLWEMKKPINTLTGAKKIYVVANYPSINGSDNEAALLAETAAVADMHNDNNFVMCGTTNPENNPTLVAMPEGTAENNTDPTIVPAENTITVEVGRVVAKVAMSINPESAALQADGTLQYTWDDAEADLTLTYAIDGFVLVQGATSSYIGANYWADGGLAKTLTAAYSGTFPTPGLEADGTSDNTYFENFDVATAGTYAAIALTPTTQDAANLNAMDHIYTGENYPMSAANTAFADNNNTTYAWIKTNVTSSMIATWDATINPDKEGVAQGGIVWIDTPVGGTDSDIYIVSRGGKDYISDAENYSDLANGIFGGDYETATKASGEGVFQYVDGIVYFQYYLGNNKATGGNAYNDYDVARNEFIHGEISDIVNGAFMFPGYPGIPTDPDGPDPIIPDDPVDGTPTQIVVNVDVMPWVYRPDTGIVLGA